MDHKTTGIRWIFVMMVGMWSGGCSEDRSEEVFEAVQDASFVVTTDGLTVDSSTGVPYAWVFQFPVEGFDLSDFGFGFGSINSHFCMASHSNGCTEYGAHTGRDSIVGATPFRTEVVAPADGIVRVTTDRTFGGFGSDTKSNPDYAGCLIVLEHELANGQRVTTLLGHLLCESGVRYLPEEGQGNPANGEIVHRGQYVGHVAHYWHGSDTSRDWHHVHWGMRKGAFSSSGLSAVVQGYVKKSEFSLVAATHALTHPTYVDPFVVLAANSDLALEAHGATRHHPSGSLLQDSHDAYWIVIDDATIRSLSPQVVASDRYDIASAVRVMDEELECYTKSGPVVSQGPVVAYQRPGRSTVVLAHEASQTRYDVIRWEALLSWGFSSTDLVTDPNAIAIREETYTDKGMHTLRPGTLVKADESSEVSIVTFQGTRQPIASEEVFERLGFRWERIVSIPGSVIDAVAGPRTLPVIDRAFIGQCTGVSSCVEEDVCGGGGPPDVPEPAEMEAESEVEPTEDAEIQLRYTGSPVPGSIVLQAWWQPPGGPARTWADVTECRDTNVGDTVLDCIFSLPHQTHSFEFQILLPEGGYWGDQSCGMGGSAGSPQGGCGESVGLVTLTLNNNTLLYDMVPNNQDGNPYFNGSVGVIP